MYAILLAAVPAHVDIYQEAAIEAIEMYSERHWSDNSDAIFTNNDWFSSGERALILS